MGRCDLDEGCINLSRIQDPKEIRRIRETFAASMNASRSIRDATLCLVLANETASELQSQSFHLCEIEWANRSEAFPHDVVLPSFDGGWSSDAEREGSDS